MFKIFQKLFSRKNTKGKRKFSISRFLLLLLAVFIMSMSLLGVAITSTIPNVIDFNNLEEIRQITPQAAVGLENYNYYKFVADHKDSITGLIVTIGGLLTAIVLVLATRRKRYNNIEEDN